MTFLELQKDVYSRLGFEATPSTVVSDRIKSFLNQAHRSLLSQPGLSGMRDDTMTLTTVAGQARYALQACVSKVRSIRATETTRRTFMSRTYDWYARVTPDQADPSGTPYVWVNGGYSVVGKQPSDASKVYLKSTSASDVQVCYVDGVLSTGDAFSASVTLTGTTAVQLGTYTTITSITKVALATAAVGTVTMHEDSGTGTELMRIGVGKTSNRFMVVYLYPCPSSAETLLVDVERKVETLTNPTDEPMLPEEYHMLLAHEARAMEYERQDDKRMAVAKAEAKAMLSDLKWQVAQNAHINGSSPSQGASWDWVLQPPSGVIGSDADSWGTGSNGLWYVNMP